MKDEKIKDLINAVMGIPGFGPRSARRAVVHLLSKKNELKHLLDKLSIAQRDIKQCSQCHTISTLTTCYLCQDAVRDKTTICIVPTVADLWALERCDSYNGLYHILGGNLSAINGIGPEDLNIGTLLKRIAEQKLSEIIMALGATMEAQTTSRYLTRLLEPKGIKITTLAYGIPLGGELDYLDTGTIATAINDRR